jgi:hypothetical protein
MEVRVCFTLWLHYSCERALEYPLYRNLDGPRATLDVMASKKFLLLPGNELWSSSRKKVKPSHYMPWRHIGGEEV